MSLQFVLGNSGTGKTQFVYQTVIDASISHPEQKYLILVPEQFTMQTQKDLCALHPNHGIMNIDALSFGRLAQRVFAEQGEIGRQMLDDEGKNLILRKIATKCEDALSVLKGNLKKQGYVSEVKSVLSEFVQYGVDEKRLDELIEGTPENSLLRYKLQDLRLLYQEFEAYIAERYITKEEILDMLAGKVQDSLLLKGSILVFDGFTGFTPVQIRLLGELMKVCQKMMITVLVDAKENTRSYRSPYEVFAISKEMIRSVTQIATKNQIEIEPDYDLRREVSLRYQNNPELSFLEQHLFRTTTQTYEENVKSIHIHLARNPKQEAEFVAQQIRYYVREKGYRYRDLAVIASDLNVYAVHLERACHTYGISFFMDNKKSILLNAYVDYLRSLLSMMEQNFTYQSVFRFLRTGMGTLSENEVDALENYVLALGIRGYKKWDEQWVRLARGVKEEELAALNELRKRVIEPLTAFATVCKKRKKTVREVTEALYDYLVEQQCERKLHTMEEEFQAQGQLALAKEYAQVYRISMELFDKFVELLGDEPISMLEYCELLDAGLEEAKVAVIPPSMDQVVIGDVERTRLKESKVLFFVGGNDHLLPGNLGQAGLLSEADRDQMLQQSLTLSPGLKEKLYIQKFYLYMNFTKASKELVLSYSRVSAEGKALRPAYLIQDFRRMYPKLVVRDEEKRLISQREMTKETVRDAVVSGLREREFGLSEQWKELYSWYFKHDPKELRKMLDTSFYRYRNGRISSTLSKRIYGDEKTFSVSRLEQFATCAYAHFLKYGLRLKEREQYEFEALDLGNIAHKSMEVYSEKVEEMGGWKTPLSQDEQKRLVEESVEKSIRNYHNTVLYSSARNEYTIARIKRLIQRSVWAITEQMRRGDFVPRGYEIDFGHGKIDRVEVCEQDDVIYVKVTDYKTGSKAFDVTSFYHGLQIQLPVYLNAAMDLEKKRHPEKEVKPAGFFYYRMKDPIVEKEKDEEALEQAILSSLKLDGILNGEEDVVERMEHSLSGTSKILPVGKTTKGEFTKASKVVSAEGFLDLLDYTRHKQAQLRNTILEGETSQRPYQFGKKNGCEYCNYKDICGFDPKIEGYEYRQLKKIGFDEMEKKFRAERKEEEKDNGGTVDGGTTAGHLE
jgi:ATP-dependent helicase/nuclease subunit B